MKAPNSVDPARQSAVPADEMQDDGASTPRLGHGLTALIDCDRTALNLLIANRPHGDSPFDPDWHARYLEGISELVRKILLSDELVAPLRDIVTHLVETREAAAVPAFEGHEVVFIHAYAAAEISYLMFNGVDEQSAAQQVTRRLITHNVPLPHGGDSRGWVRLLKWRATLKQKRYPAAVYEQYEARFEALKESGGA
jgi:hypothetical protein